ncbi:MAG: ATP-dependent helicase [Propionibacteriaceae bacterium]|jgi:DNA helicase-2/ATP-dependent DNA helicase PcrA|nr:ATP-dependent helicase [Propionibacteriaceae bacterium]
MIDLRELLQVPFSAEQLAAITAELEPAVIVAGAGTGKTTVMAARVVWLVCSGQVRPDQVLGLTFTRKATAQLSSRVREALAKAQVAEAEPALVLTYDAFAARLVSEYGVLVGVEPGRMLNDAARYRLAYSVVAAADGLPELGKRSPGAITRQVLALSAQLQAHLVAPEDVAAWDARFDADLAGAPTNRGSVYAGIRDARQAVAERAELLGLVAAYQAAKREGGFMEFGDQLAAAARLAELPQVGEALREQFHVVLLDEYQDTSAAQAELLQRLFAGHAVTAVGDPSQAIYGWRGAAASNLAEFPARFAASGQQVGRYPLTINRRSGPLILDAANQLAAGLPERAGLELAPAPQAGQARIQTALLETAADELAWIADRVAALGEAGTPWSDIAVLARGNRKLSEVYAELAARDIPAEIVGLGGLLDVPAVAEITATLRLLHDPLDNPALIRLLTSPRWAIGLPDLAVLGRQSRGSLLAALADPGPVSAEARERFAAFRREMASLRPTDSLSELVAQVIDRLGLDVELRVQGGVQVLEAFQQAVADFVDFDTDASLGALLAYLEAEQAEGVGLEQPLVSTHDSVKLLTVHKAKGLEWPVVFLAGLTAASFPQRRGESAFTSNPVALPAPLRGDAASVPQLRTADHPGIREYRAALGQLHRMSEDRLAYVAVTRAKRLLCATSHIWAPGVAKPKEPSVYLSQIADVAGQQLADVEAGTTNPLTSHAMALAWPRLDDTAVRRRRQEAAGWVLDGADPELTLDEEADISRWRARASALLAPAGRVVVAPEYLSVSALGLLARDREQFSAELALPVPKLVSRSQRAGIRFHRWLEQRMQGPLTLDEEVFDAAEGADEDLIKAYLASEYANQVPVAVEAPFTLTLAGRVIRGRIDAVFATDCGFQVVDWKTGDAARADPLQLACYRLAWAQLRGVGLEHVDAVFYDLPGGRVIRPKSWTAAELERFVASVTRDG